MTVTRQSIRLSIADAVTRHLEVEHVVEGVDGESLVARMPVWCPGSYLVREYAGMVSAFEAIGDGAALESRKRDKTTWEIRCAGQRTVTLRYRVFAPELTVRTNDVTPEHAFVHPPATFMAIEGRTGEAIALEVEAPAGWTVSTALPGRDGGFRATNYDHLIDSPLEIGPHAVHRFEAAGRRHEFVVHGTGNLDLERALEDTRRIVETEIDFFGGTPPYERYLFLLHLTADHGGGLEHDASCVLGWPKLGFRPEKEYRKFLTLIAHEFFHVWNVRRIRPETLLRYDYFAENYTRLLWVFEGFTTYYDELFPVRAGCYGAKEMLQALSEHVTKEAKRRGGTVQSLEQGSFDSWIGLYQPTADSPNTQAHYYLKGMLVAWKLDLHLRAETDDRHSLDDVMRHLWKEFGRSGRGVPEDGMSDIIRSATGVDASEFLRTHVERPGRMVYDDALDGIGLRVRRRAAKKDEETPAWLGASFDVSGAGARLTTIVPQGPAHAGGLQNGDLLVALDGHRLGRGLDKRLATLRPGETILWAAFRRDRLVQGELTSSEDPIGDLEIVPLEEVDEARRARFEAWAQRPFSEIEGAAD